MLYGKSPFDLVYERGDSVALAVISGKLFFPPDSHEVIKIITSTLLYFLDKWYYNLYFLYNFYLFQNFNKVIKMILTIDHLNRPNINNVLEYITHLEDSLHHEVGKDPYV